jgi:hypothetical protein
LAIFISYSHADADFVKKLGMNLVRRNVHVWIDNWELNVGDSILNRVQGAIEQSGALLIVLSKASVASSWCNKELNAGLMRELEEKRVLVLPVLIEDCDIPIFLREKKYADFRTKFDDGLKELIEALAKVTSTGQGRIETNDFHTDWAETWFYEDEVFAVEYTLIQSSPKLSFTLLTQITVRCNEAATHEYREFARYDLGWMGRINITERLAKLGEAHEIKVRLPDQLPNISRYILHDPRQPLDYRITIRCQRLGEDNGKDQLVNVTGFLVELRNYLRNAARRPTPEEMERFREMLVRREQ